MTCMQSFAVGSQTLITIPPAVRRIEENSFSCKAVHVGYIVFCKKGVAAVLHKFKLSLVTT